MREEWIVGEPGGPNGPFYSVVTPQGEVIAMQIPDQKRAEQIARIPEMLAAEALLETIMQQLSTKRIKKLLGW